MNDERTEIVMLEAQILNLQEKLANAYDRITKLTNLAFALANDWGTAEGTGQIPGDLYEQLEQLGWEFEDTFLVRSRKWIEDYDPSDNGD